MATFCDVADIATFLQVTIAAGNASALAAIVEASAAIQNYCHQVIDEVEDDEYTFDVDVRQTRLFLPELPVTDVAEVIEDGETLTVDDDYKLGLHGILHRVGAYWYPGIQTVTVTYSHGHVTIPDIVKSICIRAAARAYQSGLRAAAMAGVPGVQATSLGDYSVQYSSEQVGSSGAVLGASAAVVLLPSEKRYLDDYKLGSH